MAFEMPAVHGLLPLLGSAFWAAYVCGSRTVPNRMEMFWGLVCSPMGGSVWRWRCSAELGEFGEDGLRCLYVYEMFDLLFCNGMKDLAMAFVRCWVDLAEMGCVVCMCRR